MPTLNTRPSSLRASTTLCSGLTAVASAMKTLLWGCRVWLRAMRMRGKVHVLIAHFFCTGCHVISRMMEMLHAT